MTDSLGTAAQDVCVSIVNHYSFPLQEAPVDRDNDDTSAEFRNHANSDLSPPYFDNTLGYPMPELDPRYHSWHQRCIVATSDVVRADATTSTTSARNENARFVYDAVQALLKGYESIIHPCVQRKEGIEMNNDNTDRLDKQPDIPLHAVIEIVRNYELLIAHAMKDRSFHLSADGSPDIHNDNNDLSEKDENYIGTASKIIPIIADDIFHLSTNLPKKTNDESTLWKVRNVLLPCLLRLIEHSVVLLTVCTNNQKLSNQTMNASVIQHSLAIATVVAVPFVGDGKLNSGTYSIGSLLDWIQDCDKESGQKDAPSMPSILSLAYTLQRCSIPQNNANEQSQSIMLSNFMQRSVVDFSVPSAHAIAPWTDGVTGIGSRVAMNLLRAIHHSSLCIIAPSLSVKVIEENLPSDNDRSRNLRRLLCSIGKHIGIDILVSCIRTHFFGRVSDWGARSSSELVQQPQTRGVILPMIQRRGGPNYAKSSASIESSNSDEKPHVRIPMRVSAAAILLCSVILQPCNLTTWDKASSDALPIALTLLDDVQSIHLAIGSLIFMSTIDAASAFHSDETPSIISKFSWVVPRAFEGAIHMVIREEPIFLTAICLAQSKWIRFLEIQHMNNPDIADSSFGVPTMARKAAAELLVAMGKQARVGGRDGNDERIAGAFVAGINPLLALLATLPKAASLEIARVGLSAMLPLIGWSGMSLEVRSAQVAGLAGLISLMYGAYPIMPHHGQKIMTELFLLLDRAQKDTEFVINSEDGVATNVTSNVAFHAAGVALTVCGKSAETILVHVEATKSSMAHLINRCHKIQAASEQLRGSLQ